MDKYMCVYVYRCREMEPYLLVTVPQQNNYRFLVPAGSLGFSLVCLTVREREMFYLTTHSAHFIYGYMASDIWLRTILIVRKETHCRHIGYSYRLTARVLLYAPSHRQDNIYHGLCYTSRGALAGMRNTALQIAQPWGWRHPTEASGAESEVPSS